MAATYSAFMTTRFYSPVFNTALFDGPLRIYFSQSYESSALKIYHMLQTQYQDLWNQLKAWSQQTHEHVFLLIYPEPRDVKMIFDQIDDISSVGSVERQAACVKSQDWEEGLALGMCQPMNDLDMVEQIEQIEKQLQNWIRQQSLSNEALL